MPAAEVSLSPAGVKTGAPSASKAQSASASETETGCAGIEVRDRHDLPHRLAGIQFQLHAGRLKPDPALRLRHERSAPGGQKIAARKVRNGILAGMAQIPEGPAMHDIIVKEPYRPV
jgi:hypothetical protein